MLKVVLVSLHPAIDTGSLVGMGFGSPKAIHKQMIKALLVPTIAPISLASSTNIPKLKVPNKGPPRAPATRKVVCTRFPILLAKNAKNMHNIPLVTARLLPIRVAFSSGKFKLNLKSFSDELPVNGKYLQKYSLGE